MESRFRALTSWTNLEILSEPYVVLTFRGYVAALEALDVASGERYELLIGAKSLADGMEPIRQANGGMFIGMKIRIKKDGTERTSPYIIEHVNDMSADAAECAMNHDSKVISPLTAEDKLWHHIEHKHRP